MTLNLLLISNSTNHGQRPFEHVQDELSAFYGPREVLFVPFALAAHDTYTDAVGEAFARAGVTVRGLHTAPDPVEALTTAEAVFVGGGNTFRLLSRSRAGGTRHWHGPRPGPRRPACPVRHSSVVSAVIIGSVRFRSYLTRKRAELAIKNWLSERAALPRARC